MSSCLDALVRLLDDAVAGLDASAATPSPGRVPPLALVRGDRVVADNGQSRTVRDVEPTTGEVRITFEGGHSVVVPPALTVKVRR